MHSRNHSKQALYKAPFDHDKDYVLSLINKGWSDTQIAAHFNVTKDTIWSRRIRWGFPSGSVMRDVNFVDDIETLWKHGYSVEQIAEVLKTSECNIYVKMREHKIRDKPRLGLDIPEVSVSDLGKYITQYHEEDPLLLVTFNRQPKFVLVPVDDYLDMKKKEESNGTD